jgi:hypothetical protein
MKYAMDRIGVDGREGNARASLEASVSSSHRLRAYCPKASILIAGTMPQIWTGDR